MTKTENKGTITYTFDSLNRLSEVSEPDEKETSYTYDGAGNRKTEKVQKGMVSLITVYAETSAKGLPFTVQYTYSGLGQKVKEAYQGATYTYTYDGTGNLLSTQVNGITKSTTAYDLLGRAIRITDGKGKTTIQEWNAFDKISKVITPEDGTIVSLVTTYQYDKLGKLALIKDNRGVTSNYIYDSLQRNIRHIVRNEVGDKKIVTDTTYDPNKNVLSQTEY